MGGGHGKPVQCPVGAALCGRPYSDLAEHVGGRLPRPGEQDGGETTGPLWQRGIEGN
jgi:hypothetical protein